MSTVVEPEAKTEAKTYSLTGTLLEACTCNVLCPCWIGEDPDGGTCDSVLAYHIEAGQIRGVDVSGLTVAGIVHIPGNVLAGNWKIFRVVDEGATPEQVRALADAFTGKLGGPLADLAGLIGEELGMLQVPISYQLEGGNGSLVIEGKVKAVMSPYKSLYGETTTLRDSVFSTIPGSPAWVAKATEFSLDVPEHGFKVSLSGGNAIQGTFHMEA
jgi:hypothetical protein